MYLTEEEVMRRVRAGEKHVIRLKVRTVTVSRQDSKARKGEWVLTRLFNLLLVDRANRTLSNSRTSSSEERTLSPQRR